MESTSAVPHRFSQYLAGLTCSLQAFAFGSFFGWSSPAYVKIFENPHYNFTETEWSNIASILNIGSLISALLAGYLMKLIGKKTALLFLVLPITIGWACIIIGNSFATFFAGRFLTGAGGAVFIMCIQYTSEIAIKEIRGILGTFTQLLFTTGILYGYTAGTFIPSLFWFNFSCAILPLIFFVLFFFMPETPFYLVQKKKDEAALEALRWLRGPDYDSKKELDDIKTEIESQQQQQFSFKKMFMRRSTIRGLVIALGLVSSLQLSGINAVLFYTEQIFREAGVGISSEYSAIIIGLVQVLATLIASLIIDKAGRKILLLISTIVMSICLALLGIFYYLKDNQVDVHSISFLPLTSLSFYIIAFAIGLGPIPWVIVSEIFGHDVKAIAVTICGGVSESLSFLVTNGFSTWSRAVGSGPLFWIFSGIIAFSSFFVATVVPETKGKSLSNIQALLSKK